MISGVTSNPINFTSNNRHKDKEVIDVSYKELPLKSDDEFPKEELSFEERVAYFEKAKKHLSQNVHVSTVLAGFGALALTVAKGKNGVALLRNLLVKSGESVSKGAVSLWGKITKKTNTDTINKIEDKAKKLLCDETNTKLLDKIEGFIAGVTGNKDKASKFVESLQNHGLRNGKRIVDFLVALGIAVPVTDKISDNVEQKADKKELIGIAKELFNEVVA